MIQKLFPSKNTSKKRKKRIIKSPSQGSLFSNGDKKYLFSKRKKRFIYSYLRKFSSQIGNIKVSTIGLSATGIIGVCIIFLIYGPFLQIQTINISRKDSIINIPSSYESMKYIRGKNILFLDNASIIERLQKSQKSIQNIELNLDFPDTLNISLTSYPAIFQTQGYLILSNGVIVKKEDSRILEIPEIGTSKDIGELFSFNKSLHAQEISNIFLLQNELRKNIPGFIAENSKYFITEKEILIKSNIDTIFIFDLSTDIKSQIQKLAVYQKEQENISEKKYIYIDVRIPGKLFLCGYEEEFSCRENLTKIYGDTF